MTRFSGLGSDNVISMTAVDVKGKLLQISSEHNPDLLWALRGGGGGNMVIVTEFVVRTTDVSMGVTTFYSEHKPGTSVGNMIRDYQNWFPRLDKRYTTRVDGGEPNVPRDDKVRAYIDGWCMGSVEECKQGIVDSGNPGIQFGGWKHLDYLTAFVEGIGEIHRR